MTERTNQQIYSKQITQTRQIFFAGCTSIKFNVTLILLILFGTTKKMPSFVFQHFCEVSVTQFATLTDTVMLSTLNIYTLFI